MTGSIRGGEAHTARSQAVTPIQSKTVKERIDDFEKNHLTPTQRTRGNTVLGRVVPESINTAIRPSPLQVIQAADNTDRFVKKKEKKKGAELLHERAPIAEEGLEIIGLPHTLEQLDLLREYTYLQPPEKQDVSTPPEFKEKINELRNETRKRMEAAGKKLEDLREVIDVLRNRTNELQGYRGLKRREEAERIVRAERDEAKRLKEDIEKARNLRDLLVLKERKEEHTEQINDFIEKWTENISPFNEKKAKSLHKELAEIIKNGENNDPISILRLNECIEEITNLEKVKKFYNKNLDLKENFNDLLKNLQDLQKNKILGLTEKIKQMKAFTAIDLSKSSDLELINHQEEIKELLINLKGNIQPFVEVKKDHLINEISKSWTLGFRNNEKYEQLVEDFANELNVNPFNLLKSIEIDDINLHKDWLNHTQEISHLFKSLCNFSSNVILKVEDPKKRVRVAEFFLDVTEKLKESGNYFTAQTFYMSLELIENNLKIKNQIGFDKTHLKKWSEIRKLFAADNNYKNLRNAQRQFNLVPSITLINSDLIHAEEVEKGLKERIEAILQPIRKIQKENDFIPWTKNTTFAQLAYLENLGNL